MSSRDYHKSNRDALPPIRDVLGDQLDQPSYSAYSFDAVNQALPSTSARSRNTYPPASGPTLPPIHHSRYQGYPVTEQSSSSEPYLPNAHPRGNMSQTHRDSHSQSQTSPQHPSGSPGGYSFDVFRPSSSGLVHASSSSRSQGILRSTRADAGKKHASLSYEEDDDQENDTSSKRYVCQHCGKRFGRPSSLKTHEIVHSDDKPYECTYPGCGKTFTVPSNMRRHYRKTHEAPSGRNSGSGEDEDYPQESAPSSSGKTYYTSSRR